MKKYIIENVLVKEKSKIWDSNNSNYIEFPKHIINFMKEYEDLCKKYNISLGHEDRHGAFEFQEYKEDNIHWACYGHLNKIV